MLKPLFVTSVVVALAFVACRSTTYDDVCDARNACLGGDVHAFDDCVQAYRDEEATASDLGCADAFRTYERCLATSLVCQGGRFELPVDPATVTVPCTAEYVAYSACNPGANPPPTAPVCGNAFIEPGEECDDGNSSDLDACRNDCTRPDSTTSSSSASSASSSASSGGGSSCEKGLGTPCDGCLGASCKAELDACLSESTCDASGTPLVGCLALQACARGTCAWDAACIVEKCGVELDQAGGLGGTAYDAAKALDGCGQTSCASDCK